MLDVLSVLKDNPGRIAVIGNTGQLNGETIVQRVEILAQSLIDSHINRVALLADNGPAWIIADLACQKANVCLLPLPLFFSQQQMSHCLEQAGIQALMTDNVDFAEETLILRQHEWTFPGAAGIGLSVYHPEAQAVLPENTAKITFTSGTTGTPKGVCLSQHQMLAVSESIIRATGLQNPRHLCLLPLTTLLENIAGVYSPLLVGGQVVAPGLADVGIKGSSQINIGQLLAALETYQPNTLILIPQLLLALTTACDFGWRPPGSLQFIAVGGATVSENLIDQARAKGLPVYEGYGLSECGSVVTLNTPAKEKMGSCGRVLDHVSVSVDDDEIIVAGNSFLGYAGDPASWNPKEIRTGDIGYVDGEGFVHVTGRRKNLLISSFGRNISPEWLEAEMLSGPLLNQCVVFGDSRPYCCALVFPRAEHVTNHQIQQWIEKVNKALPDYARVKTWMRLPLPLSVEEGLLTENGRPRREQIYQHYFANIESLYEFNEKSGEAQLC